MGCAAVSLLVLLEATVDAKRENLRGPLELVVLGLLVASLSCGAELVLMGSVSGALGNLSELTLWGSRGAVWLVVVVGSPLALVVLDTLSSNACSSSGEGGSCQSPIHHGG